MKNIIIYSRVNNNKRRTIIVIPNKTTHGPLMTYYTKALQGKIFYKVEF